MARWIEQVEARPDALALTGEGQSLTMTELDGRAASLALAMAAASPDPSVPVPVVVSSWVDAVVANLAGWIAGRPTAHLDPTLPPLRLNDLYRLIEPRAAVVAEALPRPGPDVTVIDPARPGTHPDVVVHGPGEHDTSALVFTSGSTGRPKGWPRTSGPCEPDPRRCSRPTTSRPTTASG